MRIKSIVCVALLLVVTVVAGKRRRDWGCKAFRSQIQIYHPSGLRVTQSSANVQTFGIKVYINKPENATRTYDLWVNTTTIHPESDTYVVYEPLAIIRPNDLFDYSIMKQYENGRVRWYDCIAFRVHESRIKPTPQARIGSSKAHVEQQRVGQSDPGFTNNQTAILEEVINDLASNCEGTTITNNFYLTERKNVKTESALKAFTIGRLAQLLPTVDWNDMVTNVFRSNGQFGFEVKTAVDKQKILRLLQATQDAARAIRDYDKPLSSEPPAQLGDSYEEEEESTSSPTSDESSETYDDYFTVGQ